MPGSRVRRPPSKRRLSPVGSLARAEALSNPSFLAHHSPMVKRPSIRMAYLPGWSARSVATITAERPAFITLAIPGSLGRNTAKPQSRPPPGPRSVEVRFALRSIAFVLLRVGPEPLCRSGTPFEAEMHGADARVALAEVLGMAEEDIGVRDCAA
jgi:hypothetical protein